MPFIHESEIIVPSDRQRKTFDPDKLAELALTITTKGLMHAIVLREGRILVAGETRLKCMRDIWAIGGNFQYNGEIVEKGMIPFTDLGKLSPLEAEEAELEENTRRTDLTWQEQSSAIQKLHKLRTLQAQAKGEIHTVADTSAELTGRRDGSYQNNVREAVIVAKHLDNPLVAAAKNQKEAIKIIKREEASAKYVQLAESVGKTFSGKVHTAVNGDCLAWLRNECQADYFDVILTDPPYGMEAQNFGTRAVNTPAHQYDDSPQAWKLLMDQWAPLSFRAAKSQAHAYVFCDIDNFPLLKEAMRKAGWYVFRTPLVIVRPNAFRTPLPDEGPRRQYEICLYAIKGHKHTTGIQSDVITAYADSNLSHGAQKPISLYENLLSRSVRPGDRVLDCFSGTGTIFPAAHKFKVIATGVELNPEYYAMGLQRLRDLDAPGGVSPGEAAKLSGELAGMLARGGQR
jgi:site-specific DNA-methyltransferase (adenine-specific)